MQEGEEIVVIAEDDDTFEYVSEDCCALVPGPPANDPPKQPEKMIIFGWRRDVRDIFNLLEDLSAPGSEVHVFCSVPTDERIAELEDTGFDLDRMQKCTIIHHEGSVRRHVEQLPLAEYTSCLIVADEAKEDDPMSSDSQSLSMLLLWRDVQMKSLGLDPKDEQSYVELQTRCPTLVEILDARTQESVAQTPTLTRVSDFCQSAAMVSRSIAMVSEDRNVNEILTELLGGSGCGFEVQPAFIYVKPGESLTFMQLAKRLIQEREQIVIGYQLQPALTEEDTVINPRDKDEPKTWDDVGLLVMKGPPLYPDRHDGSDVMSTGSIGVTMTMGGM